MLNDDGGSTSVDTLQMGTGLTGLMGPCWGEGHWKFTFIGQYRKSSFMSHLCYFNKQKHKLIHISFIFVCCLKWRKPAGAG